jgi:hypothetical protein
MNADQLQACLKALSTLLRSQRCPEGEEIALLADAFTEGRSKVATITGRVLARWEADGRLAKHPSSLKALLIDFQKLLAAGGAIKQSEAISHLVKLCAGVGNQSVGDFVTDLKLALSPRPAAPRQPARRRPTSTPFTPDNARRIADALTRVAQDRQKFDEQLDGLKPSHKVAELQQIAAYYLGYRTTLRNKEQIISAMRKSQREDELKGDRRGAQNKVGL